MADLQGDLFLGSTAPDVAVYVDHLFVMEARGAAAHAVGAKNGHRWCHMWSDDLPKLHAMAAKIGLRREWFQENGRLPHYDLTPAKREFALKLGARERSLKDWLNEKHHKPRSTQSE